MKHSILLFLLACQPTEVNDDTGDTTPGDSGNTEDSGDTNASIDGFGNLTASLHDDHGSVVFVQWEQDEAGTVHVEYTFENDEWFAFDPVSKTAGTHQQVLVAISC